MKLNDAVTVLGSLAQQARLKIFRLLVKQGEDGLCAGDISKKLGVPKPTLSFHLKELVNAGLYLILAYSDSDKVALNVGFYYMANAAGRLIGTLLSGVMYLKAGLDGCLWTSAGFVLSAVLITLALPRKALPAKGNAATA